MQIGKVVGARVVAVARGAAKAAMLRDLGADVVIDTSAHKEEPLRKLIKVAPIPEPHAVQCKRYSGISAPSTKRCLSCRPCKR